MWKVYVRLDGESKCVVLIFGNKESIIATLQRRGVKKLQHTSHFERVENEAGHKHEACKARDPDLIHHRPHLSERFVVVDFAH